MCREMNREPAWVAAIKLALTQGRVNVESVADEANLVPGRERTVVDILATMADRDLLVRGPNFEETGECLVGPVLRQAAPSPAAVDHLSDAAVHQWDGGPRDVRG
jgi:hypothetical protein